MKNLKFESTLVGNVKRFEFSAPYKDLGKVRTELTIDYIKREFYFEGRGKHYFVNNEGKPTRVTFKIGDPLDSTFKAMFGIAEFFARKELGIKKEKS